MENENREKKSQKSTLLLVLFLFVLFNAVQLFRTSIKTTYFTEDISGDYAPIEATVVEFKPAVVSNKAESSQLIPVFSFLYEDEETTLEGADFAFDRNKQKDQPFQPGETYSLWVHKRWGKLILPHVMAPEELGRTQLRISGLFLFLAVAIWILRNKLAKKI